MVYKIAFEWGHFERDMDRKLASIQRIRNVRSIEGADQIDVAEILGWEVVIRKDDNFHTGDLVVFCEPDSILPDRPEFEFLRPVNFRIKTRKFRKQVSQGIAFPLHIIPPIPADILFQNGIETEGLDVTEILGITKWEPTVSGANLSGQPKGNFPFFLRKTDEPQIQQVPDLLERHAGKAFYITEKLDGTSATYFLKDGEFGICSRNIWLKDNEENKDVVYIQIAKKFDIENLLRNIPDKVLNFCGIPNKNIAIQGEIVGPGVQKNKYGKTELDFYVFSVFAIDEQRFLNYVEFAWFCGWLGLKTVPVLELDNLLMTFSVKDEQNPDQEEETVTFPKGVLDIIEASKGQSKIAKIYREGIVIRSATEEKDPKIGRLSFKAKNPDFLLKYDE